jgi:hypothetical protein
MLADLRLALCIVIVLTHSPLIPRNHSHAQRVVNNDKVCETQHPAQASETVARKLKHRRARDIGPVCKIDQILEAVCVLEHREV